MPGRRDREADLRALRQLARASGVQTSYRDVRHRTHRASPEALVAVLRALGVAIDGPGDAGRLVRSGSVSRPAPGGRVPAPPDRVPGVDRPTWGTFLPLYALRTR